MKATKIITLIFAMFIMMCSDDGTVQPSGNGTSTSGDGSSDDDTGDDNDDDNDNDDDDDDDNTDDDNDDDDDNDGDNSSDDNDDDDNDDDPDDDDDNDDDESDGNSSQDDNDDDEESDGNSSQDDDDESDGNSSQDDDDESDGNSSQDDDESSDDEESSSNDDTDDEDESSDESSDDEETDDSTDEEEEDTDCESNGMKIMPDENGWVGECSNDKGLQGHFYRFADEEGSEIEVTFEDDGRICVVGSVVLVPDEDSWGSHYGAGIGFDLCKPDKEYEDDKVTMGECPNDVSDIIGFSANVVGELPENYVKFAFEERDPEFGNNCYLEVLKTNDTQTFYMDYAAIDYEEDPTWVDPSNVTGIQVMIEPNMEEAADFEFCLENIEILTSRPSVSPGTKWIGNITQGNSVPSNFGSYWNQITPENEGKWDQVQPSQGGAYNWSAADQSYNYAVSQGIPFKIHTLVWGSQEQNPAWVRDNSVTAQDIEAWIQENCEHFSAAEMVDVVNEPDNTPPDPAFLDLMGGSGSTGHDWVIWAFEKAHQYCPNKVLILNDFNVLRNETDNFVSIAKKVEAEGLLGAIGCQSHSLETMSMTRLRSNMFKVASVGVPLYISEYDVELSDDQEQLEVFQKQFPYFYNHPDVVGITLWGYVQGQHWRPDAWLLGNGGNERPALTWLKENYLRP